MPPKKDKPAVCDYPGCKKPPANNGLLYCGGHVLWPVDNTSPSRKDPPKKIRKK